jgi:cell wall-associated NlpC family hydrolase
MTARDYPRPRRPAPRLRPVARLVAAVPGCLVLLALALLSGCGGPAGVRPSLATTPVPARLNPPPADPRASNEVLMRAIGLVGTPYRHGGNTPAGGFDCSGLVGFVFRDAAGLSLPRSTAGLVAMRAPGVGTRELAPGDLLLFSPSGGRASHIGIFVGEARFVHAPSTGGTVRLDRMDSDYWRRAFVGARRVLTAAQ